MNSTFQRKNILQNVYDLDFQQTRLSLLNLFNNEEYIENGITYSRPHFKFLYDSKSKRNLVFINLDLINYLIDEKLIPITTGFQEEIDILDERVTINYNLIQTIFQTFLERIFFEDDDKVYIYTQKYNLTTLEYEFELYDLTGKLNKSEFDNFYNNEYLILETDVLALNTNLNNLQDDFDALTTNLSTNYYTKLQTFSQSEINTFLNEKISKIVQNNNTSYFYLQVNNVITLVNANSNNFYYTRAQADTRYYLRLFQTSQIRLFVAQINNVPSLYDPLTDFYNKTQINDFLDLKLNISVFDAFLITNQNALDLKADLSDLNNYYQKINLVSAVKYVLSQTNNVLNLYNLLDDFYDESEIDLIVGGLESQINTLDSIKLTTPINNTNSPKIIQIDEFQNISLVSNGGGGQNLVFYQESVGNNTAKIRLNQQNFDHFLCSVSQFFQRAPNFNIEFQSSYIIKNWDLTHVFLNIEPSGANPTFAIHHLIKLQFYVNSLEKIFISQNETILENTNSILLKIAGSNKINMSSVSTNITNSVIMLSSSGMNLSIDSNSNILRNTINTDIRTLGANQSICDFRLNNINFFNVDSGANNQYCEMFFFNKEFSINNQINNTFLLEHKIKLKNSTNNAIFDNIIMSLITTQTRPNQTLSTVYSGNFIEYNANIMINNNCNLKVDKILPYSGNIINLGETNNTTTYVRINSYFSKNFIENYTGNPNSTYFYYYTQTTSSRFTLIPDSGRCFDPFPNNSNYTASFGQATIASSLQAKISLSCRAVITCAALIVGESSIFIKNQIKEKQKENLFNYKNIVYQYKQNYKEQSIENLEKPFQFYGVFVEDLKENIPELLLNSSYNLTILENKKQKYLNKTFKEKIEIDLFCELFDIDKELMQKYQMKFELIGKEVKILEINLLYIFFEGDLQFNENDQIIVLSYSLNADKCLQHLLFQTKTLKEENNQLKEQINNMEKRLEKIEKLLLQN